MAHWYSRPVFFVRGCAAALEFYGKLGFKEIWRHEEDGEPVAVQVELNSVEIILNRHAEKAGGGRLFLSLEAGEATATVRQFQDAGIDVTDAHWGMPVRIVTDPDGNDLLFFEDGAD